MRGRQRIFRIVSLIPGGNHSGQILQEWPCQQPLRLRTCGGTGIGSLADRHRGTPPITPIVLPNQVHHSEAYGAQSAIALSTSPTVNRPPSVKPHSRAICFSLIRIYLIIARSQSALRHRTLNTVLLFLASVRCAGAQNTEQCVAVRQ